MNTIKELKAKERYNNLLIRKNKEKNKYKNQNSTLRIEKMNLIKAIKRKEKEIERLNNIINSLEKELKEDYKIWMCNSRSNGKSVKFGIDVCKTHFYNRLQELKGGNSNE